MSETCVVCRQGKGPEKCEVCGFSDNGSINRQFPIPEDTKYWLETVVKPYRVQWEAKKREAELLAQLEEAEKHETKLSVQLEEKNKKILELETQIEGLRKREVELIAQIEELKKKPPLSSQYLIPDGFVQITGGTFTMGSPANEPGRSSDEAQHQVMISPFYMGKYPVTQKEYQEVMGMNPSYFRWDDSPVERVNWYDAVEYCNKRSRREGLTPAYSISGSGGNETVNWNRGANGYRLPTEAEWEYACRAGTTTAYNTGANISDNTGWYRENSNGCTHVVGQKPANAWGLYDMHGNVWEWCWDWYSTYNASDLNNPSGSTSGAYRVIRGGGWDDSAVVVRSAYRNIGTPSSRNSYIGFRLVRP